MPETNEQKARKWLDARYVPGRSADKTFISISSTQLVQVIAPLFEAGPGGEATPRLDAMCECGSTYAEHAANNNKLPLACPSTRDGFFWGWLDQTFKAKKEKER